MPIQQGLQARNMLYARSIPRTRAYAFSAMAPGEKYILCKEHPDIMPFRQGLVYTYNTFHEISICSATDIVSFLQSRHKLGMLLASATIA
jgi:hypothetical protein